jgi:transporter family protein
VNSHIGILFGLIAMAGWGIADFIVARAVRKASTFTIFIWSQAIGLSLYVPMLFVFKVIQAPSLVAMGTILVAGFFAIGAYLSYYKGLQVGKVSLIAPISACWAIVTVVLSSFFLNESLSSFQILAVSLAIFGAIMVSFRWKDMRKLNFRNGAVGIKYAFVAMMGWALYYSLLDLLVSELSWFLPVLFVRLVAVFYLFTYAWATKRNIAFPKGVTLMVVLTGFLEFISFFSYGIGIDSEYTAIVAPISATSPVVTITLAKLSFGETLDPNQKIGIVAVLISLVLLFM